MTTYRIGYTQCVMPTRFDFVITDDAIEAAKIAKELCPKNFAIAHIDELDDDNAYVHRVYKRNF
ncbi:MAG: hypothetical protein LBU09_03295 [Endomicrobium sp.]|nr:hypothetical protein [Endomicrobium sp.]